MRSLSPQKEALCKYIIGTIEDDGYMRRELKDIVDDLAFSLGIIVEESELMHSIGSNPIYGPSWVLGQEI